MRPFVSADMPDAPRSKRQSADDISDGKVASASVVAPHGLRATGKQ
ncbi:hypothetical protein C7S16_7028 [Burkholderia thailandensis]|uniref:Uncharacterized protein n=1 Tax=Burkholderia thailandensis TaxID=57975 RepID=A0AAW9CPS8_BURTH|nr:hypothetical protein [Burkholderia thailandensis]MDW9252878.1 hypothetical protein [Burkholderia thailandensis]